MLQWSKGEPIAAFGALKSSKEFSVLCLAMPGVTSSLDGVQLNKELVSEVRFPL